MFEIAFGVFIGIFVLPFLIPIAWVLFEAVIRVIFLIVSLPFIILFKLLTLGSEEPQAPQKKEPTKSITKEPELPHRLSMKELENRSKRLLLKKYQSGNDLSLELFYEIS